MPRLDVEAFFTQLMLSFCYKRIAAFRTVDADLSLSAGNAEPCPACPAPEEPVFLHLRQPCHGIGYRTVGGRREKMIVLTLAVIELRGESSPDGPDKEDHGYGEKEHGDISACSLPEDHGQKQRNRDRSHEEPAQFVKAAAPYEYPGEQV